jgi:hypothetical protein
MAVNPYFSSQKGKIKPEQTLYEDIIIESLKIYGQDVYYLPRTIVNESILGNDIQSVFNSSYTIEMYIENTNGFDGEGDLFTKFGIEIRDQATFIVARRRWKQTLMNYNNEINSDRPREGDLIYLPLSKSMFQIVHVEHEQPFYQLNNLPTYKLKCELFEFSDEKFDTNVSDVDAIDRDYSFTYELTLAGEETLSYNIGETVLQYVDSAGGIVLSGEVSKWEDSDRTLSLIHFGGNDGLFHEPIVDSITTSRPYAPDDITATVASWTINDKQSNTEINDAVEASPEWEFLDFSEANPFGDPS